MMEMSYAASILAFYNNIDIFLVVLVRILGFILILPILSGTNIPTISKIGLAVFIAIIVVSTQSVTQIQYENSLVGFVLLIIQEFMVGFIVGFAVYIIFAVFFFVGQLVDYQIGFSMVSVFDPISQIQVPITGNLYYLTICALFIANGGFTELIYTVARSYEVLPVGMASILNNEKLILYILRMIADYFVLGVRISLPVVGTILIVDVALGLLTKAVPQMNVFVVGMPIKLFIGLIVLMMIVPALSQVYQLVYKNIISYIMNIIWGMMPS